MNVLKERLKLSDEQIYRLIVKMDLKSTQKVSWTEFLTFLNAEGIKMVPQDMAELPMEEQIRAIITDLRQLDESYFGKDR